MEKVNRSPQEVPREAEQAARAWYPPPRARRGQRSYAKLTGSVYSRPALCLDILALLTASLTTDGSKTFIMLQRAELQTIGKTVKSLTPCEPSGEALPSPAGGSSRPGHGRL